MANITRWDPFGEMLSLRQAMDRLFEDSWVRVGGVFSSDTATTLAVDVYESDNELVVTANVPGIKPKDIDISIQGDTLTIKGETHSEATSREENYYRRERRFGAFYRQLLLPRPVKSDAAEAEFENGVLRLRIPMADEARERKIPIKGAPQVES